MCVLDASGIPLCQLSTRDFFFRPSWKRVSRGLGGLEHAPEASLWQSFLSLY